MQDVIVQKSQIRAEIKNRFCALSPKEGNEKSAKLAAFLLESHFFKDANLILAYSPLPDEVNIAAILSASLGAKKKLALPRLAGSKMNFFYLDDLESLVESAWGLKEPRKDCARFKPQDAENNKSLALLPGRAFALGGARLGRGKGCYDKFLADFAPRPLLIGVGFSFQLFERLPTLEHDIKVDYILTEDGFAL